jgi:hypothetical protein
MNKGFRHEFLGFRGFQRFVDSSTWSDSIPATGGIYVVLRTSPAAPRFRSSSVGGHFKGYDPTVPVRDFAEKWVPGAILVYVGRAETSLRTRIRQLVRFGEGRPVGHRGGRYLWQLLDSDDLVIAWRACERPSQAEAEMIEEFEHVYGRLPFANLVHGSRGGRSGACPVS